MCSSHVQRWYQSIILTIFGIVLSFPGHWLPFPNACPGFICHWRLFIYGSLSDLRCLSDLINMLSLSPTPYFILGTISFFFLNWGSEENEGLKTHHSGNVSFSRMFSGHFYLLFSFAIKQENGSFFWKNGRPYALKFHSFFMQLFISLSGTFIDKRILVL